jgi:hypothetical protein
MGKIGKISVIPKDFSNAFPTMEKSLREKGLSRIPGTIAMKFPYRDLNGRYRTGLDENAPRILRITDENEKRAEQRRIKDLRKQLEEQTGMDLSPTSDYYNYTSKKPSGAKVEGVKLADGENIFNLDDPWEAITFYWLSAHPTIASSLQAYERGEFPADTTYYVVNEDVEDQILYKKKKTANDAIIKFDSWSLEKRRKVARLLDLPVTDDTKEGTVYNMVDEFLKSSQVTIGTHKGSDPISVFSVYANLRDDVLEIKDLVDQAFKNNIYKEKKGGRVYEGELEVFLNREELVNHLLDDGNQGDRLELEKKLKAKKLAKI